MTVQESPAALKQVDSFATVREWIEADPSEQAALIGAPGVAAPLRELEARVERIRARGGACGGLALSPHVRSLAKMVGALEMRIESGPAR